MTLIVIPIALAVLIFAGLIVALPARFTGLQSRAIGDKIFRKRLIIALGFIAFLVAYLYLTWTYAGHQAARFQTWIVLSSDLEYVSQATVQREIWLRLILLSGGSDACFNSNTELCAIVTTALSEESIAGFRWVVIAFPYMLFASISGFAAAFFTWRFTDYDGKVKRAKSAKSNK